MVIIRTKNSKMREKTNHIKIRLSVAAFALALMMAFAAFYIPSAFAEDNYPPDGTGAYVSVPEGRLYLQGEVIVKFADSKSRSAMSRALSSLNGKLEKQISKENIVVSQVPRGETVEGFIKKLNARPDIEYAQPNYIYQLDATVDDPYAQPPNPQQWHLKTINAFDAWDITMGSADIKVAVIDTGIDLNHPEFLGRVHACESFVEDDSPGGGGGAQDDNGHGTHVAGIIAANADGVGTVGIAPGVKLIIADVFGWYYVEHDAGDWRWVFGATTEDIIEGIEYAVENGARVLNLSLGSYYEDAAEEEALNNAAAAGVVVVAAAGNDGKTSSHYPSDYDACVGVIATTRNDTKASYSNYGAKKDISAPGGDGAFADCIFSTVLNNDYGYKSGTSMASPMIAGVAALMLSVNPDLTAEQIKTILYETAVDLGTPGKDIYFGHGRVDARAAVAAAGVYTITATSSDTDKGTVSGGGAYLYGAQATVNAAATAGNCFLGWFEDEIKVSDCADYTFTVTADRYLVAKFESSAVTGVALDKETLVLYEGESYTLTATVNPSYAANKSVTWESSDTDIAAVSPEGTVTAAATGGCAITVSTRDGGFTARCEVTVMEQTLIESSVYATDRDSGYLTGVPINISAAALKANLSNPEQNVRIYNKEGIEYTGGKVATGMSVKLIVGGEIRDELTVVVRGDTNGDGYIDISDYTHVRLDILKLKALTDVYKAAADVNTDGYIDISDYTLIRLDILELKRIH